MSAVDWLLLTGLATFGASVAQLGRRRLREAAEWRPKVLEELGYRVSNPGGAEGFPAWTLGSVPGSVEVRRSFLGIPVTFSTSRWSVEAPGAEEVEILRSDVRPGLPSPVVGRVSRRAVALLAADPALPALLAALPHGWLYVEEERLIFFDPALANVQAMLGGSVGVQFSTAEMRARAEIAVHDAIAELLVRTARQIR